MMGYVPKCWGHDIISFLYKRKGDRKVPKNYRPITIAPSFGKHFERVVWAQLGDEVDLNTENHAYISERSCQTAILKLSEYLRKVRLKNNLLRSENFQLIPIILAEDISAAFESLDHHIICRILDLRQERRLQNGKPTEVVPSAPE